MVPAAIATKMAAGRVRRAGGAAGLAHELSTGLYERPLTATNTMLANVRAVKLTRPGQAPEPGGEVEPTQPKPDSIRPDTEGAIHLAAESGRAVGPEIEYMPEWKAYGWFTARDRVEWDVVASPTTSSKSFFSPFLKWRLNWCSAPLWDT